MGIIIDEWKKYVETIYLKNGVNLEEVPYQELKMAFFAGMARLALLIDELSNREDDENAIKEFRSIKKDIFDYWDKQRMKAREL